jgi:outer membrane protein assembly factor BamB
VQPSNSAPQATASPRWVAPGAGATVTGSGFAPGEHVAIALGGTSLGTVSIGGSGNLPATAVTIPATAPFGPTGVTVTGQTSGKTANAAIDISNAWPQFGDGERHQNNEPNDPTLFNIISPGGGIFLHPAWMYQSGSVIDGSPVVARGVAYAATTAGSVVALDVHNGAPFWTWTHPGGSGKIVGTPALDMVHHLLFVTANNGTLYAVNAATGSLAWSRHIGGLLSSPVFANGTVFLTTQNASASEVEAIADSDTPLWSQTLGSATHVTPAVDAARRVVVVGQSDGRLAAFGASRGRRIWSVPTGGAITASPSVILGTVFVGTASNELLAVNESTGQVKWTYQTQGAVNATPTLTNQFVPAKAWTVYDGDSTGRVYALTASNGAFQFSFGLFKGPVTGVATVRSVLFAETQYGRVAAARSRTGLVLDTGSKLSSSPVVLDGTLYVGMEDGHVDAFTTFGQAPLG